MLCCRVLCKEVCGTFTDGAGYDCRGWNHPQVRKDPRTSGRFHHYAHHIRVSQLLLYEAQRPEACWLARKVFETSYGSFLEMWLGLNYNVVKGKVNSMKLLSLQSPFDLLISSKTIRYIILKQYKSLYKLCQQSDRLTRFPYFIYW